MLVLRFVLRALRALIARTRELHANRFSYLVKNDGANSHTCLRRALCKHLHNAISFYSTACASSHSQTHSVNVAKVSVGQHTHSTSTSGRHFHTLSGELCVGWTEGGKEGTEGKGRVPAVDRVFRRHWTRQFFRACPLARVVIGNGRPHNAFSPVR